MFLIMLKIYVILSYLLELKYIKIHLQEIPPISRNVLEFFCVPLYTDYLFTFQVPSTCDTKVEYQIWSFCYNLFSNYPDNSHIDQPLKM